jgi:hypothetical protein
MKRIAIALLALLLCFPMLLIGCNEEVPAGDPNNGGSPNPPAGDGTYVKAENYIPTDVFTQMKAYFDAGDPVFATVDRTYAPLRQH